MSTSLESDKETSLSETKRALLNKWLKNNDGSAISTVNSQEYYELSFAQQRLWFLEQLIPDTTVFNIPYLVHLKGELQVPIFKKSLDYLTQRHAAFRTQFKVMEYSPVQELVEHSPITIQYLDVSSTNDECLQREEVNPHIRELVCTRIPIENAPLCRAMLIKQAEDDYLFCFVIHHLIADGWSLSIFQKELVHLYQAYVDGQRPNLDKLAIQYTDFSTWQRKQLASNKYNQQLTYWKEKLHDLERVTYIPHDFTVNHDLKSYDGTRHYFDIGKALTAKLKFVAKQHRASLYMVLLAGLKLLLFRYSGAHSIAVGCPIANRRLKQVENIIGFFVNTLVIRSELSEDLSVGQFIEQVKQTLLEAYDNQELPFELVINAVNPERDLSMSPLFNVGFVMQNTPSVSVGISELVADAIEVHNETSQLDLLLSITEVNAELKCFFEFSTALYDESTITYLTQHFTRLLDAMVEELSLPISNVTMMTSSEMKLIKNWSDVKSNYQLTDSIASRFEAIVQKHETRPALKVNNRVMSYGELNNESNKLAHYLTKKGIGIGDIVGLFLTRNENIVIAILAILKMGATYVPLDTNWPKNRIEFIIDDLNLKFLISESRMQYSLPDVFSLLLLDKERHLYQLESINNLNTDIQLDNIAYIIYTSGSTGMPKGVLVKHENVMRLFEATNPYYQFKSTDVWSLFHSYAFDFSVWEIWGALLHGGCLLVISYDLSRSPEDFYREICEKNVSMLSQTPSAFKQLIQSAKKNKNIHSLRYVFFGGEKLELNSLAPWFSSHLKGKAKLINMYGITETTVHVTHCEITEAHMGNKHSIIGKKLDDLTLYILDKNKNILPIGIPGEIWVGGAGVARGYYNRSKLTEERFCPLEYGSQLTQNKFYKTGDIGMYLPCGSIAFIGRQDYQVKIRGFRIEIAEIEYAIKSYPGIREAVVSTMLDKYGNANLLAYYTEKETVANSDQWKEVFDQTYKNSNKIIDKKFNISGWNSLYDGKPIPSEQMSEWLDNTVEQICQGENQNIVELGCGTGLIVNKLVNYAKCYLGLDISQVAIEMLKQDFADFEHIDFLQQAADNLSSVANNYYNKFIINSVAQYFPNINYFVKVFSGISEIGKANSTVFIGDLRSLPLLEDFYYDIEATSPQCNGKSSIDESVKKRISDEHELIIDPGLFLLLKKHINKIDSVQIRLKKGKFCNELTRFRYDVHLRLGNRFEKKTIEPQQYTGINTIVEIETYLKKMQPTIIWVKDIPNARLNNISSKLKNINNSIDPFEFEKLANRCGYHYELLWAGPGNEHLYNVALFKAGQTIMDFELCPFENLLTSYSLDDYANAPKSIDHGLAKNLKKHLQESLPSYMIPNKLIKVEKFYLTANGKIEMSNLPSPEYERPDLNTQYIEPKTNIEKKLAEIWGELLGINNIGIYDNFFDLGGHSLLATQLIFKLEEAFNKSIPLYHLFERPNIAWLSNLVEQTKMHESDFNKIDFYKESTLNFNLRKINVNKINLVNNTVLLTGATGFFGAFILDMLLQRTTSTIICLVRAKSIEHGFERLKENLNNYGKPFIKKRVEILLGDLSLPYFGLELSKFEGLADNIDEVYHNASMVNFIAPYNEHRGANVDGTHFVIQLCNMGKYKAIHYISTTHVFSLKDAVDDCLYESTVPSNPDSLSSGYTQSKWVAERMLINAAHKGLPLKIYRLGRIWGDSQIGACQSSDFLWLIIDVCIKLGCAPNIKSTIDVIPADRASSAILKLSREPAFELEIYHLIHPKPIKWQALIQLINDIGYQVKLLAFSEWHTKLITYAKENPVAPINGIVPLITKDWEQNMSEMLQINADETVNKLTKKAWTCPAIDHDLMSKYMAFFSARFESH